VVKKERKEEREREEESEKGTRNDGTVATSSSLIGSHPSLIYSITLLFFHAHNLPAMATHTMNTHNAIYLSRISRSRDITLQTSHFT